MTLIVLDKVFVRVVTCELTGWIEKLSLCVLTLMTILLSWVLDATGLQLQ